MVGRLAILAVVIVVLKLIYGLATQGTELGTIAISAHLPPAPAPRQVTVARTYLTTDICTMEFFATYELDALVLSVKNYADRYSVIAPVDIVIGWGHMSVPENLRGITVHQKKRSYDLVMSRSAGPERLQAHNLTANMHVIAATADIQSVIKSLLPGQRVQMAGFLTNVKARSGWSLKSSRDRTDTGEGASEVFYVTTLRVL
jgi:hypothetical protein